MFKTFSRSQRSQSQRPPVHAAARSFSSRRVSAAASSRFDGIPDAHVSVLYARSNIDRFFAFAGAGASTPSGAPTGFPPRAEAGLARDTLSPTVGNARGGDQARRASFETAALGSDAPARANPSLALVSLFSAANASRSRLFRFHLVFGGAGGGPHGSRGFARGLGRRSTVGRGLGFLRVSSGARPGDGPGASGSKPNAGGTAPVASNSSLRNSASSASIASSDDSGRGGGGPTSPPSSPGGSLPSSARSACSVRGAFKSKTRFTGGVAVGTGTAIGRSSRRIIGMLSTCSGSRVRQSRS